ncbi:threonine synthase [Acidobacteriota bacterium]
MEKLECLYCKTIAPMDVFNTFCPKCRDPLLYQYPPKKKEIFHEKLSPLEKFKDFLPLDDIDPKLTLGEGNTPLLKLNRLGKNMGYPFLYVKNEGHNPTGSFKDRGTAVAIQKAKSMGIKKIGTVSTGNMAQSTAAYGAKAGCNSFVLVKEDITEEKLLSTGIYGPVIIKVEGDYGALMSHSYRLGRKNNIYFMNSVDPFRIEGYKAIGLEIFVQLTSSPPQYILAPVSSGGHLIGLMRAFIELKQGGFIDNIPYFIGVQAQGCAPIAAAYASGKNKVQRIEKAQTIAQAITNPDPPGGNLLLKLLREHNGLMLDVSDDEIRDAQQQLAQEEGLFCLPASATVLAGFKKLSTTNKFHKNDRIVLVISGTGLKNLKTLDTNKMNLYHSNLSNLEETIITAMN